MSKDYKPAPKPKSSGSKGSPFLSGLLVGLLLGIGASVGVAIFVKQGGSAFHERVQPVAEPAVAEKPAEKSDKNAPAEKAEAQPDAKKEDRFTFYGILTGNESPVSEQEIKQSEQKPQPSEKPATESYFLQVGAFQTEQEADNAKAKLALIGLEAVVQTANIPDKGILHRVRVGPLSNLDEINKARAELARNGFNADLIKIRNNVPDQ
jgi:cell division protein FtsN